MRLRTNMLVMMVVAFVVNGFTLAKATEPLRIPLWVDGAPGTPATQAENEPVLFLYQSAAEVAMKTAVVVCPGGGYRHLAMDHEGRQIAEWFNGLGVTAAVLQYRNNSSGHQHPVPMMDGQRAIRTVRSRSREWGIDPQRLGVLGFSAGGHLAASLSCNFDKRAYDAGLRDGMRMVIDEFTLTYPGITNVEHEYFYAVHGADDITPGPGGDEDIDASIGPCAIACANSAWCCGEVHIGGLPKRVSSCSGFIGSATTRRAPAGVAPCAADRPDTR